jgi:hypothetical protein
LIFLLSPPNPNPNPNAKKPPQSLPIQNQANEAYFSPTLIAFLGFLWHW